MIPEFDVNFKYPSSIEVRFYLDPVELDNENYLNMKLMQLLTKSKILDDYIGLPANYQLFHNIKYSIECFLHSLVDKRTLYHIYNTWYLK